MAEYIKSRVRDYDNSNILYKEWITLDSHQNIQSLTVMSLWDVFGNVGGI